MELSKGDSTPDSTQGAGRHLCLLGTESRSLWTGKPVRALHRPFIHLPTSCTLYAVLVPQRLFFCGAVERKSVGKPQYLTCWGCWERKKNRCEVWVGKGVQTTREFRWPRARACGPGGGNVQRIDSRASGHGMWLPAKTAADRVGRWAPSSTRGTLGSHLNKYTFLEGGA